MSTDDSGVEKRTRASVTSMRDRHLAERQHALVEAGKGQRQQRLHGLFLLRRHLVADVDLRPRAHLERDEELHAGEIDVAVAARVDRDHAVALARHAVGRAAEVARARDGAAAALGHGRGEVPRRLSARAWGREDEQGHDGQQARRRAYSTSAARRGTARTICANATGVSNAALRARPRRALELRTSAWCSVSVRGSVSGVMTPPAASPDGGSWPPRAAWQRAASRCARSPARRRARRTSW